MPIGQECLTFIVLLLRTYLNTLVPMEVHLYNPFGTQMRFRSHCISCIFYKTKKTRLVQEDVKCIGQTDYVIQWQALAGKVITFYVSQNAGILLKI